MLKQKGHCRAALSTWLVFFLACVNGVMDLLPSTVVLSEDFFFSYLTDESVVVSAGLLLMLSRTAHTACSLAGVATLHSGGD